MSTAAKKPFSGLEKKYRDAYLEISGFVHYWQDVLGLQNWTFYNEYVPAICSDGQEIRARTDAHFEYRYARIEYFLPAYLKDTLDEREDTVVHEMVHCLVDPLNVDQNARKMLEMVVVDVTKALLKAKYSKKGKK